LCAWRERKLAGKEGVDSRDGALVGIEENRKKKKEKTSEKARKYEKKRKIERCFRLDGGHALTNRAFRPRYNGRTPGETAF